MIESIIRVKDMDPCAEEMAEDLRASGLFYLARGVVHMKVLQDRDIAQEGITMDDPLQSTLAGDIIMEETIDSTESEPSPKDNSIVLAQPTANPLVTLLVLSIEPLNVENPPA
nr:hypothetical protein CFP56_34559 [Quercus suber]